MRRAEGTIEHLLDYRQICIDESNVPLLWVHFTSQCIHDDNVYDVFVIIIIVVAVRFYYTFCWFFLFLSFFICSLLIVCIEIDLQKIKMKKKKNKANQRRMFQLLDSLEKRLNDCASCRLPLNTLCMEY